jgi:eukaryotic-like serine/threonine-protein kinase
MIGMVLGDYKLLDLIGTGGMARVFQAKHTETGEVVAIKTLPEEFYTDVTYQLRFKREVDAISRLDHPHILSLITYGETDNISYIVLPLMKYGTLYDKLQTSKLPYDECLCLMMQLGSAIDHAHAHQIIHRDLKPANIMIDEDNNAQLTDFGIAKLIEDTDVDITGSAIIGTWQYMSPEQTMGEKALTPQSDIYALGIILHEMLTGRAPFHNNSPSEIVHRHMMRSLSLADDLDDSLTPEVKFVILKALARKPTQRHKNGMAMAKALQRALRGSTH